MKAIKKIDYKKLKGKIAEEDFSRIALCKEIGISSTTLSDKLQNKSYFTQEQILSICNVLGIEQKEIPEYFFKYNV